MGVIHGGIWVLLPSPVLVAEPVRVVVLDCSGVTFADAVCSPALTPAPVTSSFHTGGAAACAESWIQRWGRGAEPWEYLLRASPPPRSPGDKCFHFRFVESPWALWHLENDPHLHDKGSGEDLALAVGRIMAPSRPWALTERRSVTRTSPY